MKPVLLAAVAFIALAPAARAQQPVIDAASIQHLVFEGQTLMQQLTQLQYVYGSLAHPTQALQYATGLYSQTVQAPQAPAAQMPGLAFGTTQGPGAADFCAQQTVYDPNGQDFEAQEILRKRQAICNLQGQAQADLQSTDDRRAGLQDLLTQVDQQPDVQSVTALQDRISAEKANIGNNQLAAQGLQAQWAGLTQVNSQRAEENDRQSAETWANSTNDAWGQMP